MKIQPIILIVICFNFLGCSVGAKVNIEAQDLQYPVSQSPSLYAPSGDFLDEVNYESISNFRFNFKKWGISSINVNSNVDISQQLNQIIAEKDGDAIVNLEISMRNTGTNSFMVFIKSVALMGSIIATGVTVSQPTSDSAAFAAGSIITYLLTPANVDIEISGTVVKFIGQ